MKQITWQFYVQSAYASLKFFSQALSSAMLRHILLILANNGTFYIRFIYFEKATKLWEIPTLDLSYVVPVKFTVEILQNVVAFSNITTLQPFIATNFQVCNQYFWTIYKNVFHYTFDFKHWWVGNNSYIKVNLGIFTYFIC